MTTIKEDYVSFETAKLLKEKGFDWNCETKRFYPEPYYDQESPDGVYSSTLQMAMKWLRDVHHLVIQIEFIDFLEHGEVWLYSIIERKTIKILTDKDENFTEHSYEEACEAAIKYCLENLI